MSFLIAYQSNPNANKINQMAIVTCLYLFWSWGNKDSNIKKRYRGWLNYSNICFSSLYRAQSDNNWSFVTAKSEDLIIFAKNNKGNKQNVQIRSRWVHLWPIYADLFAKVVNLKSFLSPPMYSDVFRCIEGAEFISSMTHRFSWVKWWMIKEYEIQKASDMWNKHVRYASQMWFFHYNKTRITSPLLLVSWVGNDDSIQLT